jgi:putative Ig domain-containing protein
MMTVSRLTGLLVIGLLLAGCFDSGGTDTANAGTGNASATTGATAPPSSPSATITIQGNPSATATVGEPYSFQPTVTSSGTRISFAASGLPSWLTFNASTGALAGTPSAGDEGTTGHIVITASTAGASATTTPFTISVQAAAASTTVSVKLSWAAPTENTDGTPVTDLAGYHIYYGMNPAELTLWASVAGAGSTTYVVGDLPTGTYYFSVVAYNSAGVDSGQSNLANETI